jgi:hypothetical protein
MRHSRPIDADVELVTGNFLPVNWDPLSVMMELGTPKR